MLAQEPPELPANRLKPTSGLEPGTPHFEGKTSDGRASTQGTRAGTFLLEIGSTPTHLAEIARAAGVRDARVLEMLRSVPRAGFVPAELAAEAYLDEPLPIPHSQVTTQPSLVAKMVEALELAGSERVLEVGTGHGFQSALLARLAGFV